jgi:hypothetical protein
MMTRGLFDNHLVTNHVGIARQSDMSDEISLQGRYPHTKEFAAAISMPAAEAQHCMLRKAI